MYTYWMPRGLLGAATAACSMDELSDTDKDGEELAWQWQWRWKWGWQWHYCIHYCGQWLLSAGLAGSRVLCKGDFRTVSVCSPASPVRALCEESVASQSCITIYCSITSSPPHMTHCHLGSPPEDHSPTARRSARHLKPHHPRVSCRAGLSPSTFDLTSFRDPQAPTRSRTGSLDQGQCRTI